MKQKILISLLFLLTATLFFYPMFTKGYLPIPSDTIVGLYHPFRDLYADKFSNGVPFKNFLITDPVRQQYPWRELAISHQKQGELPLWNPYAFSGTPLLANFQTAAFYPLNVLFFILPFPIAWSALIYLQPLLAGAFIYIYLRHLQLTKQASLLGSVAFAFGGFMTAWLEWGTLGHTVLWLPMILLSIDKVLFYSEKKKKKSTKSKALQRISYTKRILSNRLFLWSLVFVFSLTVSLFAGHLQTFIYVFLFSLCYLFLKWMRFGRTRQQFLLLISLLGIFIVLTIVQWLPTVFFIMQSAREVDQMNGWMQPGWFIPWQHLIQFVVPDFFGNPTTLNYWGVWNYGEFIGYVGLLPLILAIYALYSRRDRKTLFFGLFLIVSIILATPTFFAQLPYVLHIPFLSSTQPTRLLLISVFCLAVLAALGFDTYMRRDDKKKIFFSLGLFALIFGSLWLYITFGSSVANSENMSVTKRNLLLPSAFFFCIAVLFALHQFARRINKPSIANVLLIGLLLLTVADLFRFSQKFNTFSDPAYLFPNTKTIDFLQKQPGQFRVMATTSELLPPNFSTVYRIQSIEGYDPLYLLRYGEFMSALKRDEPDISAPFGFNRIVTPQIIKSRLVDLVGVQYVLSLSEIKEKGFQKKLTEGKTMLYENKEVFPRMFFAKDIVAVSSKEMAMKALYDKKINLRKTAVVEEWDKGKKTFGQGSVENVVYKDNAINLSITTDSEAYLVLTDIYYPSWHAQICSDKGENCQETRIYRTDYTFRGIVVPKGNHSVRFYITLL